MSKYILQNWHSANINDKEQSFCFYWKICCSLAYYSDQSSSWSTFKSKNQLRIRKRMLSLWKLVGYFINYQDLEIPGNLSKICTTFLNLNHLTLFFPHSVCIGNIWLRFYSCCEGSRSRSYLLKLEGMGYEMTHCRTNPCESNQIFFWLSTFRKLGSSADYRKLD